MNRRGYIQLFRLRFLIMLVVMFIDLGYYSFLFVIPAPILIWKIGSMKTEDKIKYEKYYDSITIHARDFSRHPWLLVLSLFIFILCIGLCLLLIYWFSLQDYFIFYEREIVLGCVLIGGLVGFYLIRLLFDHALESSDGDTTLIK